MAKDLLTREELSLLLADDTGSDVSASLATSGAAPFSPEDFGTLQKVLGTYLIPGVTAWSVLFGRSVELAEPEISLVTAAALTEMDRAVVGEVDFLQGLKGHARFVLPLTGARVLVGLALGSPEPAQEFDLIHRSSFASVLKYLLAEMRSLISRGTGRRVGTSEPAIKLWPEEVLPEPGYLVQAKIPWWVDGVQHPGLLFWADMELTRGLIGLAATRPKQSMSPGEAAWMGNSLKAPLGGGRSAPATSSGAPSPGAARPVNRLPGRTGTAPTTGKKNEDSDLSIWSLGRTRTQNAPGARSTNDTGASDDDGAPEPTMAAATTSGARSHGGPPSVSLSAGTAAAVALQSDAYAPPLASAQPVRQPQSAPAPAARRADGRPAPMSIDPTPPSDAEEVELRVELGRAAIRDPLQLGQILPLDRLAGESVDIFVNDQLVARGEVTVDGEVLAVRVTQTVPVRRKGA